MSEASILLDPESSLNINGFHRVAGPEQMDGYYRVEVRIWGDEQVLL
jgi:hypothetical protein